MSNRLACAISFALAATAALPASAQSGGDYAQCRADALYDFYRSDLPKDGDRLAAAADVDADRVDVSDESRYVLEGNVRLERADQALATDQLSYSHDSQAWEADGDVRYQDRAVLVAAQRATGDLDADEALLEDSRYQLLTSRGNGVAARVALQGETARLDSVSYSTCDPDARAWELVADRVDLDQTTGVGVARGAKIRIGSVPVFYVPYLSFPIDDRRKTGFLYPRVGYSDSGGLDIAAPYYINIAPNLDATLIPRLYSDRGVMLGGEFRYLLGAHQGEFRGDFLPDDDEAGRDRSFVRFDHVGRLSPQWSVSAHIANVSDDRYFEDFGDSLSLSSIGILGSTAAVTGVGRYWNAQVELQDWQITDPFVPDTAEPFRVLPRATFDYVRPFGGDFIAGVETEAVRFDHADRPGGERVDLKPFAAWDFRRSYGFVRPELAFRYTGYQLDDDIVTPFGDSSPSRALPIASVDTGLYFERDTNWFGESTIQTLEPRLYYLYVPYEDQSDLPVFDTQELTFGFGQLFRDNRFTSADRQTDANQATLAVTSRLLSAETGVERLTASFGQIRYFDDQRVQLPGVPTNRAEGSAYVAELDARLSEAVSLGATLQWDPEPRKTELAALRGQWRFASGGVANAAYRYRRDFLEQIDLSGSYPVSDRWRLVGRYNYSLLDTTTLEAFAGVQWESCCLAVRVLGRHYLRNREGEKNNALYVELELKGLGSLGRRTEDFLRDAILGYQP